MAPKTVAELVDEARRGSGDARDELVRRHYREIALVAVAITNDPTEAEDLSQEAFIRAFRNLDLLVDPDRFAPWLRRIVVGVSIDWLRSFRPNLYRGWDGSDEVAASSGPSPLDRLLHAEMAERVAAALNALPPRYRVPVRLYHLDGLSHAKIAAALDVPVGTVRSLVARARRKLAPLLAAYAPDRSRTIDEVFEERAVSERAPTRFLHVANGTCTTRIIEAAGIPGARSIWADPLYEGPVPGGVSDEELLETRRRFHAGAEAALDPVNDMRRWRSVVAAHEAYDELVLWYEHDLFDQLNLVHLLSWLRGRLPAGTAVSLVCINAFRALHSQAVPIDPDWGPRVVVDTPDPRDPTLFPPGVPLTPPNNPAARQPGQQDLRQGNGPGGPDELNFQFVLRTGYNFTIFFNNSVGAMKEGIGSNWLNGTPADGKRILDLLRSLPNTDLNFATLSSGNTDENGWRDSVYWAEALRPKIMTTGHAPIGAALQYYSGFLDQLKLMEQPRNAWPGFPRSLWPIVRNHTDPTDILKPEVYSTGDPAWSNPQKAPRIAQFCS